MKFIITESRMTRIISKYLDLQDFIKIEGVEDVYFVNSSDDEYGQIRYDKTNGFCYIDNNLRDEISSFFSLDSDVSEEIIGKWVENTLQMKVTNISKKLDDDTLYIYII